jgi:hypothetical protein
MKPLVAEFYDKTIFFEDPFGKIKARDNLVARQMILFAVKPHECQKTHKDFYYARLAFPEIEGQCSQVQLFLLSAWQLKTERNSFGTFCV